MSSNVVEILELILEERMKGKEWKAKYTQAIADGKQYQKAYQVHVDSSDKKFDNFKKEISDLEKCNENLREDTNEAILGYEIAHNNLGTAMDTIKEMKKARNVMRDDEIALHTEVAELKKRLDYAYHCGKSYMPVNMITQALKLVDSKEASREVTGIVVSLEGDTEIMFHLEEDRSFNLAEFAARLIDPEDMRNLPDVTRENLGAGVVSSDTVDKAEGSSASEPEDTPSPRIKGEGMVDGSP